MRDISLRHLMVVLLSALVAAAVACGGENGPPEASLTPPGGNSIPVISDTGGLGFVGTETIEEGETREVQLSGVDDPDNDPLTYVFTARRGSVDPGEPSADPATMYTAPRETGPDTITVTVRDGRGGVATTTLDFTVVVAGEPTTDITDTTDGGAGPSVEITDPADGAIVPPEVLVEGTAIDLQEGTVIWTVVQVGGLFFPQREAVLVRGDWTALAFIGGGPQDSGVRFDILAVIMDAGGAQQFVDWLDEGERTGQYPGLSSLPPNSEPAARVQVVLE